jgi:hypothetical protein
MNQHRKQPVQEREKKKVRKHKAKKEPKGKIKEVLFERHSNLRTGS